MADVRDECAADVAAIEEVHRAAFASESHSLHNEHEIVRALRASGKLAVSLVTEREGKVVAHVAASPVSISHASGAWYGLGPVGVLLKRLRAMGAQGCVVVGEPAFYSSFGFRADASLVFPGVPREYFQVLRFGVDAPRGEVVYDKAFY